MENFSYIGFFIVVGIIFLVLWWGNNRPSDDMPNSKPEPKETNSKLFWIALITGLVLVALAVIPLPKFLT